MQVANAFLYLNAKKAMEMSCAIVKSNGVWTYSIYNDTVNYKVGNDSLYFSDWTDRTHDPQSFTPFL